MRIMCATLLAAAALALGTSAHASSDYSCQSKIRPTMAAFTGCNSTALLAPGNDTRVNLALLMIDRHGTALQIDIAKPDRAKQPTQIVPFGWNDFIASAAAPQAQSNDGSYSFASGEGSICVSNDAGQAGFIAALDSDRKLPLDEKKRLADARRALRCGTAEVAAADDIGKEIRSDAGKAWLEYLRAADRFYAGSYNPAEFVELSKQKQPWIREAARYMIGRTWALVAQSNGFGTYGEIDHARMEASALDKAESSLKTYVKAYPQGRYTASAYGLLRRVYWLAGDHKKLTDAYGWQIAQMDPTLRNASEVDLAQEISAKLPWEAYTAKDSDPILLAVEYLRRMRPSENDTITRETLEAQRSRFVGQQALFDYLLAAHAYYVQNAPERVLQLIPAVSPVKRMSYLDFSRATLRALVLDATGNPDARDVMTGLIANAERPYQRQTLEIALAMHDERANALQRVFAEDSLIADPLLRQQLLKAVAGPALLRSQAQNTKANARERDIALFTLLYKQLTRDKYAAFIADAKWLPQSTAAESDGYYKLGDVLAFDDFRWAGVKVGYACPSLSEIAASLAKSPQATRPRLCLAEFVRLKRYDHFELDTQPPADELGGTTGLFPGKPYSRQTVYQRIIADASAPAEDKAYALFRAVNCYAPSGSNDCGGEDAPIATRRAWFNQLKSNHAASPWAKKLEYYW